MSTGQACTASPHLATFTQLCQLAWKNASDLQDRGRAFIESFITKVGLILRGTTAAPAQKFGETLQEEHLRGGAFAAGDAAAQKRALELSNAAMRLYGGAQYNRAMAEFRCGKLLLPTHCNAWGLCNMVNCLEVVCLHLQPHHHVHLHQASQPKRTRRHAQCTHSTALIPTYSPQATRMCPHHSISDMQDGHGQGAVPKG